MEKNEEKIMSTHDQEVVRYFFNNIVGKDMEQLKTDMLFYNYEDYECSIKKKQNNKEDE